MSQYRLTGKSASRSYELLVGWDRGRFGKRKFLYVKRII